MALPSELFIADHRSALQRSEALDAGRQPDDGTPRVELVAAVTGLDLEVLGEIAADVAQYGQGDLEVAEVDLDHPSLEVLPPFLCEVLVALGASEDPEAQADAAQHWAGTAEMELAADVLEPLVGRLVALATQAAADPRPGVGIYLWTDQG